MFDVEAVALQRLPKSTEQRKLYIFSFDVFTINYTKFDFFHNKLFQKSEESFIQHSIEWKYLYLFQWLNIYSSEHRSSKHPVYYSIDIYRGIRNESNWTFIVMECNNICQIFVHINYSHKSK